MFKGGLWFLYIYVYIYLCMYLYLKHASVHLSPLRASLCAVRCALACCLPDPWLLLPLKSSSPGLVMLLLLAHGAAAGDSVLHPYSLR